MPALYRQYRPQYFKEIAGQEHVVATLSAAIEKDKVAHAYLFQGPRGTGKTTTARVFAKRLNCLKPKGAEPCGKCRVCLATAENRNFDIIEIDAASNRGIDDIRSLRETVPLSPALGAYKIYIIDEVHMLTGEAFAALLKTLEEPVRHAVFILATTELHKVPDTILSRCQVFRFRRASDDELYARLKYILKQEKRTCGDDIIRFVMSRSDGCYRDAESLLGQILTAHDDKAALSDITGLLGLPSPEAVDSFLTALISNNPRSAIELVDTLYADGFDPEQFIQECIRSARDGVLALTKQARDLPGFAQQGGAGGKLPAIIRALVQATQDVAYVPQPLIALQLAILSVCTPSGEQKVSHFAGATRDKKSKEQNLPPAAVSPPVRKIQISQPSPAVSVATDKPAFTVQRVGEVWGQVIEKVKETNPVSSTFLRAIHPIQVAGRQVTMRAQFPLHKNFFDKQENKSIVEQVLGSLLGQEASIRCILEESGGTIADNQSKKREEEAALASSVAEIFGVSG